MIWTQLVLLAILKRLCTWNDCALFSSVDSDPFDISNNIQLVQYILLSSFLFFFNSIWFDFVNLFNATESRKKKSATKKGEVEGKEK